MQAKPELQKQLWNNANVLYSRLHGLGLKVGPEASPIIAVRYTDVENAFVIWNGLLEQGIYVNMVLPPATPDGAALLRCSLSAAHTTAQIEKIGDAFASLTDNQD